MIYPVDDVKYPLLIDATIDTLGAGLKNKDFTSVDLVNVRSYPCGDLGD